VRLQFTGKVIAVAGSNGKTGTKNLIDAALHRTLRGSISPKSYNNDIGVPVTIFAADPSHDYVVLEMGTNHHGEIAWLTEIARPDIAVITNCHAEHLEGLTDLAGVRKENASIIAGVWPSGLVVVNGDDADLLGAVGGFRGERA
jgi:UDP-N-acetylmuramoyl-tripeptide--D-alanyl-D-alanine ligase